MPEIVVITPEDDDPEGVPEEPQEARTIATPNTATLPTARRVEVAGAGARISSRRLTPERLLSAVRTAIDRRAGAQRVSRAFAAAGGAAAAADAIEALGRGHSARAGESQSGGTQDARP